MVVVVHAAVAHTVESSVALPTQSRPPWAFAGFEQVRVIVRVPVWPQAVTEHAPGALQPLQPPLIGARIHSVFAALEMKPSLLIVLLPSPGHTEPPLHFLQLPRSPSGPP